MTSLRIQPLRLDAATLATNMALAGISPRIAMEIMRHSDIKLTTKTYTDAGGLEFIPRVVGGPERAALSWGRTSSQAASFVPITNFGSVANGVSIR